MKIDALSGDSSTHSTASVWADHEGAHVTLTISPEDNVRADAMLTPDQAEQLAAGISEAARLARIVPEQ